MVKKKLICIEKYKTIYAPVPKAANSSMKAILSGLVRRDPSTNLLATKQGYWSDATYGEACLVDKNFALKKASEGWFVFTIIRNPLDRLVSCYNNKIIQNQKLPTRMKTLGYQSGMSFEDFVNVLRKTSDHMSDNHTVSQYYILFERRKLAVNFTARFENLNEDYRVIQERLKVQTGKVADDLPKINARRKPGADYMSYYEDAKILQFVIDRYRKDFEMFYPDVLKEFDRAPKRPLKILLSNIKDSFC